MTSLGPSSGQKDLGKRIDLVLLGAKQIVGLSQTVDVKACEASFRRVQG